MPLFSQAPMYAALLARTKALTEKLEQAYERLTQSSATTTFGGLSPIQGPSGQVVGMDDVTLNLRRYVVPTFTTDANDLQPAGNDWLILSASVACNLTGLQGGQDGATIWLSNSGTFPITIKHQSTASQVWNRFQCAGEVDCILTQDASVPANFDASISSWRVATPIPGGSSPNLSTSSNAGTAPAVFFSPPTLLVEGPPLWTPLTGTYPYIWDAATNTAYQWNGTEWVSIGGSGGPGWENFRHLTNPDVWKSENSSLESPTTSLRRYWIAGVHTSVGFEETSGIVLDSGNLWMVPFISPQGGTLTHLAFTAQHYSGTPPGYFKMGVYQATGNGNNYPAALLVEGAKTAWTNPSGSELIEVTTDLTGAPISLTLQPGVLYYLAWTFDTNEACLTGVDVGEATNLGIPDELFGVEALEAGWSASVQMPFFCTVPFTWSDVSDPTHQFPSTFPTGAQLQSNEIGFPLLGFSYN
jgi:hypothetical protein